MLDLPSKEYTKRYLRMPLQDKVVDSDEEWLRCGKWILINFTENLLWVDEVWMKLQVLLENGTLLMIKASTAAMNSAAKINAAPKNAYCIDTGVVICFTKPGLHEVKKAAEEIRKIIDYKYFMHYKTNDCTENGLNVRYGDYGISKYLYTYKGFLYRRNNSTSTWVPEENDTGNKLKNLEIYLKKRQEILNLGKERLSKKTNKRVFTIPFDFIEDKKLLSLRNLPQIRMSCSTEEDDNGLIEADIMCFVGIKLIDQGYLKYITCFEKEQTLSFRFFLEVTSNHMSMLKICDILRKQFGYCRFSLFITSDKKLYKYTEEGELYLSNKFLSYRK